MPRRRLTLRAYARHRRCTPSTVFQAIREHRLTEHSVTWDTRRGCWAIDAAKADWEWQRNTYPDWGGRRT